MSDKNSLVERVAAMGRQKRKNHKCAQNSTLARLPDWPDQVLAVPNPFLRSNLFGVVAKQPNERRYLEHEPLTSVRGIKITYTGDQLDQKDLDAWGAVLHAARSKVLGDEFRVTAYRLLSTLRITDTGCNRTTLNERLLRLKAARLDVRATGCLYEGRLIVDAYRDDITGEHIFRLDPKLLSLFGQAQFTYIDREARKCLANKQLAQWLFGFYASHKEPFGYNIKTIQGLTGSRTTRLDHFREQLRNALAFVAEENKQQGIDFRYEIKDDLVEVKKKRKGTPPRRLANTPR